MKKTSLRILGWFASDIRSAIVASIVAALVLVGGGALYLSKTALSYATAAATTPTPLWATIVLVLLCCGCIYYIFRRSRPTSQTSPVESKTLTEDFTDDGPKKRLLAELASGPKLISEIRSVLHLSSEVLKYHLDAMPTLIERCNFDESLRLTERGRKIAVELGVLNVA